MHTTNMSYQTYLTWLELIGGRWTRAMPTVDAQWLQRLTKFLVDVTHVVGIRD